MAPDRPPRPQTPPEAGGTAGAGRDPGPAGRSARRDGAGRPSSVPLPFRGLLDRGDPAYIADPRGHLIYHNRGFVEVCRLLYGITEPATLETATPVALLAIFDRLRWEDGEVTRREAMAEGGQIAHYLSRHGTLRREDGEISHFYGFYSDLGPRSANMRRDSESRARLIDFVRAASDCIFELDPSLSIVDLRGRIEECFGQPTASVLGRRLIDIGVPPPPAPGLRSFPEMLAARLPFSDVVLRLRLRDGAEHRVSVSGVPVFDDESGRFHGYRCTARDVTNVEGRQQELAAVLRQAAEAFSSIARRNKQLETDLATAQRSARTKVDVLAAMSHELRTPLNAIIGLAEMSAEERVGALDPRYRSYFEDIRNAGQHLLAIINQIYDAIRIDTDQLRIDVEPTRIAELVSGARALIAHAAQSRGVLIDDVATDSDERVICDAVRARQILVNLLNNSIKFTKPGGRIGIDVAPVNDREIDITVWDTGIGIPKDKQKQVFDSYFRITEGSRGADGIGLGLWISRNLAERMGGSIRLASEVGLGTRITLRLPRAPARKP